MADCTRLRLVQPLDGRRNGRTSAIDSTERRIIDGLSYSRGQRRDGRRGRGERIEQDRRRGGGKLQHLNSTDRETVKTCHYPTGRNAERCTTAITKYSPLYYVVYKGEFLCSCNAAERGLGTLQKRVAPVQTGRRGRLARRDRRGNGKRIKQDRRGRTARRTSKQGENGSVREFLGEVESRTRGICDILSSVERVAFVRLNPCAMPSAFALRGKTLTIPNTGATIGSGTHGRRTACACRSSGSGQAARFTRLEGCRTDGKAACRDTPKTAICATYLPLIYHRQAKSPIKTWALIDCKSVGVRF